MVPVIYVRVSGRKTAKTDLALFLETFDCLSQSDFDGGHAITAAATREMRILVTQVKLLSTNLIVSSTRSMAHLKMLGRSSGASSISI